jgi:chaperonin GroEL (HSP60 family)
MAKAADIKVGENVYHKARGHYLGKAVNVENGKTVVERELIGGIGVVEIYANRQIATQAEHDEALAIAEQQAAYEARLKIIARYGKAVLGELAELLGGDAEAVHFKVQYHERRNYFKTNLNKVEIETELLVELLKVAGQVDARFADVAERLS